MVAAAPTLRPYQRDALAAIDREYAAGIGSTLVVMATGLGKTIVFAAVAERTVAGGGRVLVLAHRTELLEQARRKLLDAGVWAELEKAQRRAAGACGVVVASVQTLRRKRLDSFPPDCFSLVVVDEAHHSLATGYRAILDRFSSARVLGVTATPDRMDGQGMGVVFESVAYRYELRDAIRAGWLAPIRAKRVALDSVDLARVQTRAGDLAQDQLAAIMAEEKALHGVAVPLLAESAGRKTIAFAVDVAHAHRLAEVLNRYQPGVARAIDGSADELVRRVTLAEYEAGAFRILVNVSLYTEGFDSPSTSCIAMVRPTKSRALYAQCCGRGTRLAPGKVDMLLLDFCGNAGRHRLIGPADVLAGRELGDDERAAAEAALDGQLGLDEVLDHAAAEAERRRNEIKLTAVARYRATEIDPFLGDLPPEPTERWASDPASERQLATLVHLGHTHLPAGLTKGEASQLVDAHAQRRIQGLATFKQVRVLARAGYASAERMTRAEAGVAMQRLNAGWDVKKRTRAESVAAAPRLAPTSRFEETETPGAAEDVECDERSAAGWAG